MNKVVVITGASSGIGEDLKRRYESQGDKVINLSLGINEGDDLNINLDVSNKNAVFDAFDKVANIHKQIDVLIIVLDMEFLVQLNY